MTRCLALVLLSGVCPVLSDDWPKWRGLRHDGISREAFPVTLPGELPVRWKVGVGTGFGTVSVSGRRVLTMGNREGRDRVWCLDAGDGRVLWEHAYDCELDPLYYEGGPGGTPTIVGDSVFTLSKKGHAFRLDLRTGEVIWARDLVEDHELELPEWSFACSPFVAGDRVLLNVGRGGMALSAETGETLWLPSRESSGYASVVPFGGNYLLFSAKSLFAFDAATGRKRWEFPWKTGRDVNAADPIVAGDRVILSSSSGTVMLEARGDTVSEVWRQRDMKWYFNSGVLIEGHLYSLHGTTHRPTDLMCTDAATGEIVWTESGYGSGGLIGVGDRVVLFDRGELIIFRASPEGFDPLLRQKILEGKCWTSPVYADGNLYCRTAQGDLACVGIVD